MHKTIRAVNFHDTERINNIEILNTSAQCGWHNVYVYTAVIRPFNNDFTAVDSLLISMVLEGDIRGTLKIGNLVHDIFLQPGFILCLPPDVAFEASICTQAKVINIYISKGLLQDIAFDFLTLTNTLFNLAHNFQIIDGFLENFIGIVNNTLCTGGHFSPLEMQYIARTIVARIIARYTFCSSDNPYLETGLSHPVLQKVYSFIDAHLHQRISVEQLASMAGVGAAQFARLFKRTTDTTLHQFIIKRRIEKARSLLTDTNMPIIQIAYECGFADQVHLTRLFGRFIGSSPAQFRKMRK